MRRGFDELIKVSLTLVGVRVGWAVGRVGRKVGVDEGI